ncbi:MAG: hypothetical protein JXN60_04785, partial [Lentisphaerae bacterium]|nr:hypothetical protein [Lentisphaerota bacterium]
MKHSNTWLIRTFIIVALSFHALLVFKHFPISSVTRGEPLCSQDLSYHFASAVEGKDFIAERHRIWGYSPRYMAGYPWGLWNSFSKRGYETAPALMPFLSVEAAYYVWIVLMALATPVLPAVAAWIAGCRSSVVQFCLVLGVVVYQMDSTVSYFWTFGNLTFPFVSAAILIYMACLIRGVAGSWKYTVCAAIALGVIFWLHPLAVVPLALGSLAAIYVLRYELSRKTALLRLCAVFVLAALIVLPWLVPLWAFRDMRATAPRGLSSDIRFFVMDLLSDRGYRRPFDRRFLFHIVFVLTVLGAVHRRFARMSESDANEVLENKVVPAVALTCLALLICTYSFGYVFLLQQTQPYRYITTFMMLAVLPASVGLRSLSEHIAAANRQGRIVAACLMFVMLPDMTAYVFDLVNREPARGLDPDQQEVVRWLTAEDATLGDGRILCEDGMLGNLLPYLTGREVIGGYIGDQSALVHKWASISPTRLFGWERRQGAGDRGQESGELRDYLELYNIRVIVAESGELKRDIANLG